MYSLSHLSQDWDMLVLLYFFPFKILVIFVSDIFLKNVASGKKLWMRILTACLPWYYQWPESPKWVLRKGRGQLDRLCERQSAASQRSKSGLEIGGPSSSRPRYRMHCLPALSHDIMILHALGKYRIFVTYLFLQPRKCRYALIEELSLHYRFYHIRHH